MMFRIVDSCRLLRRGRFSLRLGVDLLDSTLPLATGLTMSVITMRLWSEYNIMAYGYITHNHPKQAGVNVVK
jgi:hypothetical protein